MLGLFGALNLGQRALQANRQGVEVAGHNLANVNQPGYARQRLILQTAPALESGIGPVGTGVDGVSIQQVRDLLVDHQIQNEGSIQASLEKQQSILDSALSSLSVKVDRQAASSTTKSSGISAISGGLFESMTGLFQSFQDLSTQPTSPEIRQALVSEAKQLAAQFNLADSRLADLSSSINQSIEIDAKEFNNLLTDIADINSHIAEAEFGNPGSANDLRNALQQKLEEISKIAKIDTSEGNNGMIDLSINGIPLIEGAQVTQTLETFTTGSGNIGLRGSVTGDVIIPTGGRIHGAMEVRDGALTDLRNRIDVLAQTLISQVNAIHINGYSLSGNTGETFFDGTNAASIQLNSKLEDNPDLIQASGQGNARSDNSIALSLAQLGSRSINSLGNSTFGQHLSQTVISLSQNLASINDKLDDQEVVANMLERQRDSISGVSVDEEMTNMMKFQKAFEASARLINTIDEMLDTVLALKR